jgi:hypothetical protein
VSDYRNYVRTAAGFDGLTPETATYSGTRFNFTTTTATAVGRFDPTSLGRKNVASACRVMLQGVIAPGDYVRVIDSSGGTRFDVAASLESSGWFFLGPQDTLAISAAGATRADILVNDLSDDQMIQFVQDEVLQGIAGVAAPDPVITATTPYVVAPFDRGTFYLTGTSGAPGDITLTTVTSFGVGARIVFLNDGGAGYTVTCPLGEDINGGPSIAVLPQTAVSIEAAGTQWIAVIGA